MGNCCSKKASPNQTEKTKIAKCSEKIINLLKNDVNDVFLAVFQLETNKATQRKEWQPIWEDASTKTVKDGMDPQINTIASSIISTEEAIRQLSIGLRVDELISYKLTCHNSKIINHILDPPDKRFRVVIIQKLNPPSQPESLNYDLKIENALNENFAEMKTAILSLNHSTKS